MLNVLWLSHIVPYPPKGGVLQRSYNLMKEVAKHHNVYLLSLDQFPINRTHTKIEDAINELEKFCKYVKIIPVPCETWKYGKYILSFISLFTTTPYTVNWLYSREMEKNIADIREKIDFDVAHFDTISLGVYSDCVGNCRKLLNHHNIESHMMLRRSHDESSVTKKIYYKQEGYKILSYEKKICKLFDLNVTCSDLDSDRLLSIVPDMRIEVIPNGVDLEFFHPLNLEKEKNSLVFAGGMSWYPNRNAMLYFSEKVWPALKSEIPDIKMTVVGRDPPEILVNLSEKDDNFRVTGFVDDVRPYIDRSMVYVCPIREGGGTKLKILDALAMGKPVVADPAACEGIEVTDGATVLYARSPGEYVGKIQYLFHHQEICRQMGENAIRLIEDKYSFRNIGANLAHLYETISGVLSVKT